MGAAGKIALLIICIAGLVLGWFGWRTHQSKVRAAKRAATIERYREQAGRGDATAEALLARMYSDGDDVPRDYVLALTLYGKSADQGSAAGEAGLAATYYYGRGVPVDYSAAWLWYSKAAAQGNRYAENAVGTMLADGLGTTQDYGQAFNWFRKAADGHYARAEYSVGTMYYYGHAVRQNRAEAYRWIRKAASDGDEYAQAFLSAGRSPTCRTLLLVQLGGGLVLVLGCLPIPTNYWSQRVRIPVSKQKFTIAVGTFCIISASYSWYGYTHHLIRRIGVGINAFTACHWVMDAAAILSLIYILRLEKKRQDDEIKSAIVREMS